MASKRAGRNEQNEQGIESHDARVAKEVGSTGYFKLQLDKQTEDKRRVAEYVCENLVKEGDSIALDAGSSPMYVAEVLFNAYSHRNVSILTHNMEVFRRFGERHPGASPAAEASYHDTNIQLILTGGEFSASYNALFGVQTESAFKEYFPRLVILAVSGLISLDEPENENGLYCHATNERPVKSLLFTKPTDRRVVVTDWTKLGRPDSFRFGKMNELKHGVGEGVTIVTTSPPEGASQDIKTRFARIIRHLSEETHINVVTLDSPVKHR